MSKQLYAWKEQYYWFSFSYKGKNQGCCIVKAHTVEEAMQKTIDLGIHPKHDDIAKFLLTDEQFGKEEIELDRLYMPKEMENLGYEHVISAKDTMLLYKSRMN